MKIVAIVYYTKQVSPDEWERTSKAKEFSDMSEIHEVLTWARTIDPTVNLNDIKLLELL